MSGKKRWDSQKLLVKDLHRAQQQQTTTWHRGLNCTVSQIALRPIIFPIALPPTFFRPITFISLCVFFPTSILKQAAVKPEWFSLGSAEEGDVGDVCITHVKVEKEYFCTSYCICLDTQLYLIYNTTAGAKAL